jgi:cyclophilin family peptidyl-prolyl cis-trans isomerase
MAIAFVLIVAVIFFFSLRNGDNKDASTVASGSTASGASTTTVPPPAFQFGTGACPNADGTSDRTLTFTAAPQECINPGKTYTATLDTTAGKVVVKLDTVTTPGTANNFVALSRYHYYDNTTFFRTASSIGIIQGGSPTTNSTSDPGPGYALQDEGFDYASLPKDASGNTSGGPYTYSPGDLVMARTASPNGAGAQFFFAVNENTAALNSQGVYVKFGSVVEGLDVLEAILATAPSDEAPPNPPVTVNSISITES